MRKLFLFGIDVLVKLPRLDRFISFWTKSNQILLTPVSYPWKDAAFLLVPGGKTVLDPVLPIVPQGSDLAAVRSGRTRNDVSCPRLNINFLKFDMTTKHMHSASAPCKYTLLESGVMTFCRTLYNWPWPHNAHDNNVNTTGIFPVRIVLPPPAET